MALTKEQRDALSDDQFAVPSKRLLPIHDERHTRMAWSMLPKTDGLSEAERTAARTRILRRAKELGIDTEGWHLHAVSFRLQAMSLGVPEVNGHPNRMPFSGVLTRVDEPSDAPPQGSEQHRTLLPRTVAEQALPSLLGMAVDFTPDFDGHDKKAKIGVITEATVQGNAVNIAGFLYAADFPEECARIKEEANQLGFSYECQAAIFDLDADPWVITACVFTGAAVLYKDLAAYTSTSLAAKADTGIETMTKEEMLALFAEATKPLMTKIDEQGAKIDAQANELKDLKAKGASLSGPIVDQVMPHVDAINSAADAMEKAGVGTDGKSGHVGVLRRVAAHMCAAAVSGKVPSVFTDHDYLPSARVEAAAQIAAAVEAARKEGEAATKALKDQIAGLETQVKDLKAAGFKEAQQPQRATLPPAIQTLLAKGGIEDKDMKDGKLSTEQVNKVLDAAGIKGTKAVEIKLQLRHAGLMPAGVAA